MKESKLEKQRPVFFQVGLILALGLSLAAFEWKTLERELPDLTGVRLDPVLEEMAEITEHKQPEPEVTEPRTVIEFNVVNNDVDVDDLFTIDVEDDQDNAATDWTPPLPDEPEDPRADDPFIVVENMPEFNGGLEAMKRYLKDNIEYPMTAREANIHGTVFLKFVVSKDGSIRDIEVLRGIGGGCDEEAVRVVRSMPSWLPGKQRGKAVNVIFNLPVKFSLR